MNVGQINRRSDPGVSGFGTWIFADLVSGRSGFSVRKVAILLPVLPGFFLWLWDIFLLGFFFFLMGKAISTRATKSRRGDASPRGLRRAQRMENNRASMDPADRNFQADFSGIDVR